MKTPEDVASEIVGQFSWHSNVVEGGCLVGQQVPVSRAIAEAVRQERARAEIARQALADAATALIRLSAGRVKPKGRTVKEAMAKAEWALGASRPGGQ
jgi:hypothetical protein